MSESKKKHYQKIWTTDGLAESISKQWIALSPNSPLLAERGEEGSGKHYIIISNYGKKKGNSTFEYFQSGRLFSFHLPENI